MVLPGLAIGELTNYAGLIAILVAALVEPIADDNSLVPLLWFAKGI
jgi:hypothetical protein